MTDREDRFATFEEVQAAFDGVRLSAARSYRAALEFLYHGHPDDEPRPVYLEDGVLRVQIPLKHMESAWLRPLDPPAAVGRKTSSPRPALPDR